MTTIVSLIGQQPIPNLLPIKFIKPAAALLVCSDFTEGAAKRLTGLIEADLEVWSIPVDAYAIMETKNKLIKTLQDEALPPGEVIFNLTGGTKAMSLAAYLAAADLGAPLIYLQSEGSQSRLYRYDFVNKEPELKENFLLPALIKIDDYLRAYVGTYALTGFAKDQSGKLFEQAIHKILEPVVDEIVVGAQLLGALDIDLVVRCDNQVGIIEAKTGKGVKKGLDQLNTAGGQQYLGTYTRKFLVSDQVWDHTRSNLRDLAEARRIEIVELPSYDQSGLVSDTEADHLRRTICKILGRRID